MRYLTKIWIILSLALFVMRASAQEVLSPLGCLPQLRNVANSGGLQSARVKGAKAAALSLPFADDFSYNSYHPASQLWSDGYVLVNKSYGLKPPTLGVATFDAVNDSGTVYPYASHFPFTADTLSSQTIRLDSLFGNLPQKLGPSDSLYLSFYIQPQGRGNAPEEGDSLILQFQHPLSGHWLKVWQHRGMPLDSFVAQYGEKWKQIFVPIVDSVYFTDHFRFRFLNKASIPGSNIPSWRSGVYDHWNIDYVLLDAHRSMGDSSVADLAVTSEYNSLLTHYVSMPWKQFLAAPAAEMDHSKVMQFRNLYQGPVTKNVNRYFSIQDLYDHLFYKDTPYPSTFNMGPGAYVSYGPYYGGYTFHSNSPKYADFEVNFHISSNTPPMDIIHSNDTLRFYQRFYNYYAYDDGVPEAGYGLSNNGGRLALRFHLNTPDSLQAISMYFNQTLGNASQQYFYLTVWDDNNGQPGQVIYEEMGMRPEYEDKLFQYHNYPLKHALYLSGTFYVGWRQTTQDNLNVGFDKNNDNHLRVFYNSSGSWLNSSFEGTPMIRVVMGDEKEAWVGMPSAKQPAVAFRLWPNPVGGKTLHVASAGGEEARGTYRIYSLTGRKVQEGRLNPSIDLGTLPKGLYLIELTDEHGRRAYQKFIKL